MARATTGGALLSAATKSSLRHVQDVEKFAKSAPGQPIDDPFEAKR
jgi:hypothetical protein